MNTDSTFTEEAKVRALANAKLEAETGLNMWATEVRFINADEFCPSCEREVPSHYESCPKRWGF